MGKLCVSLKGRSWEAFGKEVRNLSGEVDMIELRLDDFEDVDMSYLKHAHILTLGTRYQHAPDLRWSLWQKLHAAESPWIDLAWEDRKWFETIPIDWNRVVLSYHHQGQNSLDVEKLLTEMKEYPAAKIKIVMPSNSVIDSLRMLLIQKREGSRFIGICTGSAGEITRLLAPLVGGEWMYAALSTEQAVAPGQIPWSDMKHRYHFQQLSVRSFALGVIGFPVEHSQGVVYHNAVMKDLGIDGVYVRLPLHEHELSDFFALVKQLPFKGLSVTMPLKEKVFPFLDDEVNVQEIGACNTLRFTPEGIRGLNTDGMGALNALEKRGSVRGKTIWIIGAGGAAKAIVVEALRRGAQVCIFNRNAERARALAERSGCEWRPLESLRDGHYDILINATSVGMKGQSQEQIVDPTVLQPGKWVMDIVTKPPETPFLQEAKARGCRTIGGSEMLILQAVEQWKFWLPGVDEDRVEKAMLS